VTVGTIFHKTRLPLQKWFLAITLILNAKKGIAARQLARDLKVNKDTAWRISMKIREAMAQREQRTLLTGLVEMDETYVEGKPSKGDPSGPGKRSLVDQFHKVRLMHLPEYLEEFCYRHNNRKHSDLFGMNIERGLGVMS